MLLNIAALLVIFVSAAQAGCRSGWIQHDESCYLPSHDTETWIDAMNFCKAYGGYLVEIEDARENNFIKGMAEQAKYTAWIGATDTLVEGEWMWFNSNQPFTYTNWNVNQPDNAAHDENCVEIWTSGHWNDNMCHKFQHYICEAATQSDGSIVG